MALQVGDLAPDFTAFVRPNEPVSLRDFAGQPVVLLFFPLAFSSVCTQEICGVAEDYGIYERLGAQVLGISVDSPYVNQKFAEACHAPFPVLSDFNREATAAYGVLRDELNGLRGVSERAAFVVGRDGRIAYSWVSADPELLPRFREIQQALRRVDG
ncbi:MAG TPA: peroxiredoxin [Longimicrobiales bacterium]|nr:peroxiredoxin [Longimicrobiales bacterium]